jgi:hypothetical protein
LEKWSLRIGEEVHRRHTEILEKMEKATYSLFDAVTLIVILEIGGLLFRLCGLCVSAVNTRL